MPSPLRDPKFGLIWSNPNQSDQTLVLNALKGGHFYIVLEAVLYHGIDYVSEQWALLKSTEELQDDLIDYVEFTMINIKKGIDDAKNIAI